MRGLRVITVYRYNALPFPQKYPKTTGNYFDKFDKLAHMHVNKLLILEYRYIQGHTLKRNLMYGKIYKSIHRNIVYQLYC